MKTLKKMCLVLLMAIAMRTYSQEFIGSSTNLWKETGNCDLYTGTCHYSASEVGILKLNDQNDEFSFDVSLFPILTSPAENDSITSMNKNMYLNFSARFPIGDLDFYESNATESTLNIPGEITINGITKQVNLIMGIHVAIAHDVESRDVHSYPVRASFIIDINPADYNLDFETINFISLISVEVRNGVINKSNFSIVK